MSRESRMLAGIVLVTVPTAMFGGMTLLAHLVQRLPGYLDNPLRQNLWRAGHAHAGVYIVLSLVMLRYVDEATLSPTWKWVARRPRGGHPDTRLILPLRRLADVDRTERGAQPRLPRRARLGSGRPDARRGPHPKAAVATRSSVRRGPPTLPFYPFRNG